MSEKNEVVISGSAKRVGDFLSQCVVAKKRRIDLELVLVRKRRELWRIKGEITSLQRQISEKTRTLSAKESLLEGLDEEVKRLMEEWDSSME